ncbi:MAG TPA: porin [Candidatus Wunengus sp. YC60]|uniref:porin n=1 Tax=Candidatus Wunengus sp. YC60 TaxID=3367697 RepID=UPI004029E6A6
MRSKWYKYVLSSVIILCSTYAGDMVHEVSAQQEAQPVEASGSKTEDLKWQLKQMEEAVQKQQEQIQALKNRLDTANTETAPIAKEDVKKAVENYLSTPEARKELGLGLPNAVEAEYTPDDEKYALSFKSLDKNYSLNLGGRMQFRYTYKDNDEDFGAVDTSSINLRRARVYMGGNIYGKNLHYYVEADADKFNLGMRDFYVYWTPLEEVNAKIGYFKVPFNRQRVSSSSKLLLQDRSIASEAFDQDRDYGLDIYGKPFEGNIEYHAAVFQGAGEKNSGDNIDNKLMYVLNARYNPFGKYDYYDETDVKYSDTLKATIGASVAFDGKANDEKIKNTNTIIGVVDTGLKYKGISWNNEYFLRTEDPESNGDTVNSDGFYTQTGYFVLPKKLEVAARYSMVDPDTDVSNDLQREYTAGINYYFRAHRSKIQADVGHYVTDTKDQDKEENRVRVQYQIIF